MTDLDDLKMNLLNWPNHPNNCGSAEGWMKKAHDRIEELEGALRALRLQALQSSVNDPANEWGIEALNLANAALQPKTGS